MAEVNLKITAQGQTRLEALKPNGTIIGRSAQCDIILDSKDVSRKHARIYQDPFSRWIIEDLQSQNGIFINGRRIEAYALLPAEQVVIGTFTLAIEPSVSNQIERDQTIQIKSHIVNDDFHAEIVPDRIQSQETLSGDYLKQLNELNEILSDLTSPSDLYPEVCKALVRGSRMAVAILRLPENTKELPRSPEILACSLGDNPESLTAEDMSNLCLSRRTLEAVRTKGQAVMAKSTHSSDAEMVLTISDKHSPRVVICSPLGNVSEIVDCLYMDIPVEITNDETFDFACAASRAIILTRKSLISMQVKAERQKLDNQLNLAHDIQAKLSPTEPKGGYGVDVAVFYEPAMWVGGDYYDIWKLDDGQVAFAVGDVSGKGLPAAMIMSNLQAALRTTMTFCTDLATVVEHVNKHLCENLRDDMFVTFFLGLFDPSENKLSYVNAGHILPLIMLPSEEPAPLGEAANLPLGILENPYQMNQEIIPPDTALLVVTDGVTETASAENGELFDVQGMEAVMAAARGKSAAEVVESVKQAVLDYRQTLAQQDDTTILVLVNSSRTC